MKKKSKNENYYKTEKSYCEFLKNKTVVLVGPAYHTKGTLQADVINSYDVVVRMNLSFRKFISAKLKRDIGNRMDVLYSALSPYYFHKKLFTPESFLDMKKRKIKWIVCTHVRPTLSLLKKVNSKSNIPVTIIQDKHYADIRSKTKTERKISFKPSTGILTIYDILQYDIKKLYITGVSFYDTKLINKRRIYHSGYRDDLIYKSKYNHNTPKEIKLMKKWYKDDERIYCDDVLKEILQR
jgi:hypothetical protein